MDPQFLEQLNSLQNYQNQQSNQATQTALEASREQLAEEANKPQCPHCGGPSALGFDRCNNCSQEVIWCGHFVGKPGTMAKLEMAIQQYGISQIKAKVRLANKVSCLIWGTALTVFLLPTF